MKKAIVKIRNSYVADGYHVSICWGIDHKHLYLSPFYMTRKGAVRVAKTFCEKNNLLWEGEYDE